MFGKLFDVLVALYYCRRYFYVTKTFSNYVVFLCFIYDNVRGDGLRNNKLFLDEIMETQEKNNFSVFRLLVVNTQNVNVFTVIIVK